MTIPELSERIAQAKTLEEVFILISMAESVIPNKSMMTHLESLLDNYNAERDDQRMFDDASREDAS